LDACRGGNHRCDGRCVRNVEPRAVCLDQLCHRRQAADALGDALGSNVVNVALILGTALAISGIQSPRAGVKRDFPVALLVPIITGVLCLDGEISRFDGALMLSASLPGSRPIIEARKQRSAAEEVLGAQRLWAAIAYCAVGLLFLVGAGRFIVNGARGIAAAFGVGEFVIGATVVAVGTSVPELATAIISKLRGHDEVGLGTILGSISSMDSSSSR
jgi:cation:H+ antiporter